MSRLRGGRGKLDDDDDDVSVATVRSAGSATKVPVEKTEFPLDHKERLSFLQITDGGRFFPVVSQRYLTEASSRIHEGEEKKAGRMVKFRRSVFIPPTDMLRLTISDGARNVWCGTISYEANNISRKRATRDDTWPEDKFWTSVQKAIQYPEQAGEHIRCIFTPTANNLNLEIKEKRPDGGGTVSYIMPCLLARVGSPTTAGKLNPLTFWQPRPLFAIFFFLYTASIQNI
jgi:hypothetical protein